MPWAELYRQETEKPLPQFVRDLKSSGALRGFYSLELAIPMLVVGYATHRDG